MAKRIKIVSRLFLTLAFVFSFFVIANPVEAKAKENISKDIIDLDVTESTTNEEESTESVTEDTFTDEAPQISTPATNTDDITDIENNTLQELSNNILPDVDAESFFAKIYNKMFSACNGVQKIVGIVLLGFFIVGLIMIAVSLIFTKKNVMWYVWATFVIAILFCCDIYAVQIVSAIANWLAD